VEEPEARSVSFVITGIIVPDSYNQRSTLARLVVATGGRFCLLLFLIWTAVM